MLATLVAMIAAAAVAPVITNPDWVRKPTGEEIASHYPKLLTSLGIEGHTTIRCHVTVQGDATDCVILFESPAGVGFGPAALSMASQFKFTPKKINGVAVAGGTVNVPITFSIDAARQAEVEHPAAQQIDATTQALAYRLAVLWDGPRYQPGAHNRIEAAATSTPIDGDPQRRLRLVEAFMQAYVSYGPTALQRRAAIYAQLFTPRQLQDTVTFLESPSGEAFLANGAKLTPLTIQANRDEYAAVSAAAMKIYCQVPGSCPAAAPRSESGAPKP